MRLTPILLALLVLSLWIVPSTLSVEDGNEYLSEAQLLGKKVIGHSRYLFYNDWLGYGRLGGSYTWSPYIVYLDIPEKEIRWIDIRNITSSAIGVYAVFYTPTQLFVYTQKGVAALYDVENKEIIWKNTFYVKSGHIAGIYSYRVTLYNSSHIQIVDARDGSVFNTFTYTGRIIGQKEHLVMMCLDYYGGPVYIRLFNVLNYVTVSRRIDVEELEYDIDPDKGIIAIMFKNGSLELWRLSPWERIMYVGLYDWYTTEFEIDPLNHYLIIASENYYGRLSLDEPYSLYIIGRLPEPNSITVSPYSGYIAVHQGNELSIIDTESLEVVYNTEDPIDYIMGIISVNDKFLVYGYNNLMKTVAGTYDLNLRFSGSIIAESYTYVDWISRNNEIYELIYAHNYDQMLHVMKYNYTRNETVMYPISINFDLQSVYWIRRIGDDLFILASEDDPHFIYKLIRYDTMSKSTISIGNTTFFYPIATDDRYMYYHFQLVIYRFDPYTLTSQEVLNLTNYINFTHSIPIDLIFSPDLRQIIVLTSKTNTTGLSIHIINRDTDQVFTIKYNESYRTANTWINNDELLILFKYSFLLININDYTYQRIAHDEIPVYWNFIAVDKTGTYVAVVERSPVTMLKIYKIKEGDPYTPPPETVTETQTVTETRTKTETLTDTMTSTITTTYTETSTATETSTTTETITRTNTTTITIGGQTSTVTVPGRGDNWWLIIILLIVIIREALTILRRRTK